MREPPGADIILLNSRKQVLLVLRDDKPSIPCPNTWALLGGYIDGNETPTEAICRELREEIDLEHRAQNCLNTSLGKNAMNIFSGIKLI